MVLIKLRFFVRTWLTNPNAPRTFISQETRNYSVFVLTISSALTKRQERTMPLLPFLYVLYHYLFCHLIVLCGAYLHIKSKTPPPKPFLRQLYPSIVSCHNSKNCQHTHPLTVPLANMRSPLEIMTTALSVLAAAGLLRPSFLPRYVRPAPVLFLSDYHREGSPADKETRSDSSINLSDHPTVSGSVSVYYSLNVTEISTTTTATPSSLRSQFKAPFSIIHRRTLNLTTSSPTITNIVVPINNLVMASEFNLFFSVMSPSSTCDLKINTQAIVCINEQIAICGNDGKYKLQACPLGQKCRAVPLDPRQTGLFIQCVPNDDGAINIAQLTSRSATLTTASASSLINNGTSPGQGSGPMRIITTNKTAAPSLSGGNKLNNNNITKTSLQTSARTQPELVNYSHAPSTAIHLFATVSTPTVPTPTIMSSAEIGSSKSEPPILRIIPVTLIGENAAQST